MERERCASGTRATFPCYAWVSMVLDDGEGVEAAFLDWSAAVSAASLARLSVFSSAGLSSTRRAWRSCVRACPPWTGLMPLMVRNPFR